MSDRAAPGQRPLRPGPRHRPEFDGQPRRREVGGEVRHVFTHFELLLRVLTAPLAGNPARGEIVPRAAFDPAALPGLMIFITSVSFNMLADGLRSAMEVKQ